MRTAAAAALFSVLAASEGAPVRIPGGHVVEPSCIVEVPNGATFDAERAGPVPRHCYPDPALGSPQVQIYAADVHWQSPEPLTSFEANWVVPPLPASRQGQVVYFWPGFKSKQPEMGYPVLQPVLMFGEGGPRTAWQLKSWFVDARDRRYPVVTAPAIPVSPGDNITSFMRLSEDGKTWTVSGTNVATNKDSTLKIAYSKAGACDYDYAMLVNENIGVDTHCARMPSAASMTFTSVKVNGKSPTWTTRANCKGNPKCDCGNGAAVADNGDVTLSWQSGYGNPELLV